MITAFTTLLWINWEHGFHTFMEKSTKHALAHIFVDEIERMKTLEDSLCEYSQFGFQKIFLDLEKIDTEEYNKGRALSLQTTYLNPGKGWWTLFKRYQKETASALKFNPEISNYVETTISEIAKKVLLYERLPVNT